ncbi:MAG TPA: argininosuccinate lyase [Granulicella sp.]
MSEYSSKGAGPAEAGPVSTSSPSTFPAPIYRDTVLLQIFEDAKRFFLEPLLAIQYAHTAMLAKQGLLTSEEATACKQALDTLDLDELRSATYDGSFEDLFFLMEHKLAERIGAYLAGKMHTARSRNDIDLTMYRMVLRGRLLETMTALTTLRARLVEIAWQHRASLMPAYTHNQPAQPTTLGHYLMAAIECFERDTERLQAAYTRINRSPMGACAITTTGFPIDRACTASLLGFDGLQVNSYGAIASSDYLAEACSALAISMLTLGKLSQDLLQWSTLEFDYLRLSDGYVQISSIMPQKRNPVPLEHVRILASRSLTQAHAVIGSLHNTPFADINDGEDDLQPLAYTAFDDALRSLRLLSGVLDEVELHTERMATQAEANFLTVTELADTLVRSTGMDFRTAHEIVSRGVKELHGRYDLERMVEAVEAILREEHPDVSCDTDVLRASLTAANFIAVRKITGGPALEVLEPEIERARNQCKADQQWIAEHQQKLDEAAARRTT